MSENKADLDIQGFFDELTAESDRAVAILGAAMLDHSLGELLTQCFVEDAKVVEQLLGDGGNAPLGTFSARINIAYGLGLLSPNNWHDLGIVRRVRNKFAHRLHGLSFDDDQTRDWLGNFKAASSGFSKHPRTQFILAVVTLLQTIRVAIPRATKHRPKIRKNATVTHVSVTGDKNESASI